MFLAWVEMRSAEKLLREKGVHKITKSTRKKLKKKLFDDDSETDSSDQHTPKKKVKKGKFTKNIMTKLMEDSVS